MLDPPGRLSPYCRPRTAGYMDGRIQACYPALPPMVGFASTATFRAAAPPRGGDTYMGLGAQVEKLAALPGPTVVVFQDLDTANLAKIRACANTPIRWVNS